MRTSPFVGAKVLSLLSTYHTTNSPGDPIPETVTPKKSWKREVSIVLMAYLMWLGFQGSIPELEILAWPFMTFALGAFGLDAYNKQTIPSGARAYKYTQKELEEK